jgi:hypothetical protein
MKLWIPPDSNFLRDTDWIHAEFPNDLRNHFVIYSADNLLEPETLREVSILVFVIFHESSFVLSFQPLHAGLVVI